MSNLNSTEDFGPMTHPKITLPKPGPEIGGRHPFKNSANHEKLLNYLKHRLHMGKQKRDGKIRRLVRADKNIAGWMKLSDDDLTRDAKQESTGIPQAKMINLPLSYVHLDDMMTYFAITFSPNRGMFYHTGNQNETDEAKQIVTIMNNHAIYAGYFREVLQGIYSMLKYNEGGFKVFWDKENGPKISANSAGEQQIKSELKWQGNRLEAIDQYNFLCDPHVHPTKLHCDGEWAAMVKMRSFYWLQNQAANGRYFNCEDVLEQYEDLTQCVYYRSPPREANMNQGTHGSETDWIAILSMYNSGGLSGGLELVDMEIKLNPTEFGLVPGNTLEQKARSRYEMWQFTILNNKYIIACNYMDNIHGNLPYYLGVFNDDLMAEAQKSISEILQPLQDFASFLLNTHVAASRKNIWGLIGYDPSMIDLKQIPAGEVAARVPMKPEAWGRDIRTGIWEQSQQLDTKQTMQDLESVMGVINQFFPTQSLPSQIANIDRAVDSQVAAVQQGANRRQQKAARLLDDSVFRNVRAAMYYNVIQYQPQDEDVVDYYTGAPQKIDLNALRNTDLPFIIGQGLKAIDRQAAASSLQQVIFALIQAPQAQQGIDLLGLIDYWTSMIDIDIDMKQFEKQVAPAEAAPRAAAGGNPIQPATAPASLTEPIYS